MCASTTSEVAGQQEHPPDQAGIGEGEVVRLHRLKEPGEAGLPAAVAPHLRDDGGGRAQHRARSE